MLARIIGPTSKADSLRVIEETGVAPVFVSDTEPKVAGIRQTRFPATRGARKGDQVGQGAARAGPGG